MGQAKHNPTAIAAKRGELPPKKKSKRISKRDFAAMMTEYIMTQGRYHV